MIQQINLYQQTEKEASLHLFLFLLAPLVIAISLLTFSLTLQNTLENDERKLQSLEKRLNEEQSKLKILEQKIPNSQASDLLNLKLQKSQKVKNKLLDIVDKYTINNTNSSYGFSPYFISLANQSDAKTWLNRIFINTREDQLRIEGGSFESYKIANFLHRLQQEQIFKGHHFAQLELQNSMQQEDIIEFNVSSILEESDEPSH